MKQEKEFQEGKRDVKCWNLGFLYCRLFGILIVTSDYC